MITHYLLLGVLFALGGLMVLWIAWIGVYALWWLGVAYIGGMIAAVRFLWRRCT